MNRDELIELATQALLKARYGVEQAAKHTRTRNRYYSYARNEATAALSIIDQAGFVIVDRDAIKDALGFVENSEMGAGIKFRLGNKLRLALQEKHP